MSNSARDNELADRGLPAVAFIDNSFDKSADASPVIAVKRGVQGYFPIFTPRTADELNQQDNVTPAQREAMHIGSLFGWDVPGAHPAAHEGVTK